MQSDRAGTARRPRNERVLAVEAGQVICPRRGFVDIETCWRCPSYKGLSTEQFEGVVCAAISGFPLDDIPLLGDDRWTNR
jgi:hypothetical protein